MLTIAATIQSAIHMPLLSSIGGRTTRAGSAAPALDDGFDEGLLRGADAGDLDGGWGGFKVGAGGAGGAEASSVSLVGWLRIAWPLLPSAGGVAIEEVDPKTLESRVMRGLYLCGEILDVEGRLGGFNFQWGWSSGTVAGRGAAHG